ncbi:CHCH domain-containing protein [Fusarium pseudoanthophilum]|uniref:CHCH domain-containing protein n=1 Tax=Fusarium pseudoanthophilum TaxID=48495 RepID=A0A8H5V0N3_9HYPO|nr:CHCH domain-containing protein [Fusarium pseudoanthophilum]
MTKEESNAQQSTQEDDDEPDECLRLNSLINHFVEKKGLLTGITNSDENAKMTDCYFEKKDWRACAAEMEQFKQCWKAHNNDQRTETKDN